MLALPASSLSLCHCSQSFRCCDVFVVPVAVTATATVTVPVTVVAAVVAAVVVCRVGDAAHLASTCELVMLLTLLAQEPQLELTLSLGLTLTQGLGLELQRLRLPPLWWHQWMLWAPTLSLVHSAVHALIHYDGNSTWRCAVWRQRHQTQMQRSVPALTVAWVAKQPGRGHGWQPCTAPLCLRPVCPRAPHPPLPLSARSSQ